MPWQVDHHEETTMTKAYRTTLADEVVARFPAARRKAIRARAAELIAEEVALKDLRKGKRVTQEQLAKRLGGRQVYVSRLESRTDMKLSTLRDCVTALGGELQLVVTFPEGDAVRVLTAKGRRGAREGKSG
jgi:hypothetical protein